MKKMIHQLFSGLSFLIFFTAASIGQAYALPFNNIVILGDSLSDTGNLFADTGIPPSPYFNGQFSNGPVWANQFAKHFGLDATSSNLGGSNYAYSGATTGATGVLNTAPTLLTQNANYLASNGGIADPNSLYVIFGGGNDIADILVTGDTGIINNGIGNIVNIATTLYGAGARNFLVVNLPDIGKTPQVSVLGSTAQATATLLSTSWNSALALALGTVSTLPEIDLNLFDLFNLQTNTLANAGAFGITNITDPCFNGVTVCANPDEYFYWDSFHPTAKVHQLIAAAAIAEVPEPGSIVLVGLGLCGYLVIRKYNRI